MMGTQEYPAFDTWHNHCGMNVTFDSISCLDAYNTMKDTMGMWQPAPDTGATYSMWDATEIEKIWVTKNAKGASAKDDVQFEYFGDPTDF